MKTDLRHELHIQVTVERKDPSLPRYVVIPADSVAPWELAGTTTVNVDLDGQSIGRRSLKRWDDHGWFVDLPNDSCRHLGLDTGDDVVVSLAIASTELPSELKRILETSEGQAAWRALSSSQQRAVREHVLAAKRSATRGRRSRKALGLPPA